MLGSDKLMREPRVLSRVVFPNSQSPEDLLGGPEAATTFLCRDQGTGPCRFYVKNRGCGDCRCSRVDLRISEFTPHRFETRLFEQTVQPPLVVILVAPDNADLSFPATIHQCMSTYLSQTRNLRPLRLRRTVAAADLPSVRVPAWQLQTMSCSCQSLSSKKRLASP